MNKCKCGCGQECKNIFVSGHNSLGKIHSHETKMRISNSNKGKNLGKKHSQEYKTKLSFTMKERKLNVGVNNPMYGVQSPTKGKPGLCGKMNGMYGKPCAKGSGKTKWYFVKNIWVQGTYEKRFVEACHKWNIPIEKCKKFIPYNNGKTNRTYRPDFTILNEIGVFEIKGFLNYESIIKLNACYKNERIYMVWKDQLKDFEKTGSVSFLKQRPMEEMFPVLEGGLKLENIIKEK